MTITFQEIADAAPEAAMVIDGAGIVVAANRLAFDALQLQPSGLPLAAVFRSSRAIAAVGDVRSSLRPGYVEAEVFGVSTTVYGVHVAPLGREGHLLISFRDLTDEQRIEKMRSDFVANASHEMRTPLASIIGSIETLQGAAKNDAKARDAFLTTMLAQATRMKRLIDDLLTLSHIELNEHIRPESTVDLVDIAKQATANLASQAKQAGVEIIIRAEEPVLVRGDADQLLQVAQNLIENALKYGAEGRGVEILCNSTGGKGRLQVTDRGGGIDPIHIPRLTERFYRVNTQQSRARGGTGLGLAIVKHIVARHQGRLSIASQIGRGSTFTVSVPLIHSIS